jgi:chaperonin cofactor prefoldin
MTLDTLRTQLINQTSEFNVRLNAIERSDANRENIIKNMETRLALLERSKKNFENQIDSRVRTLENHSQALDSRLYHVELAIPQAGVGLP